MPKPAVKSIAELSVERAVRFDLAELAKSLPTIERSALAVSALTLARQMDAVEVSAASKAACARSLRETLDRLRDLVPADVVGDRLDELTTRRSRRRGAVA